MCGPEDPLFTPQSPAARKGPISSKRVSSQDPLLRKFVNFSLNSLMFTQILAHKPPIWKFSAHKPPNLEIFSSQAPKFGNYPLTSPRFQRQMSVRKPHTSEIRAAHPYLKKSWVPPRTTPPLHLVTYNALKRSHEFCEIQTFESGLCQKLFWVLSKAKLVPPSLY